MVSREDPHLFQQERLKNTLIIRIFHIHYGDITDTSSIQNLIEKIKPTEIYNLAAQSHVGVSFFDTFIHC